MFLLTTAFALVLIATFGIVLTLTRPSAIERNIEARLASIHGDAAEFRFGPGMPEFLKTTRLSKVPLIDAVLQHWSLAHKLRVLLAQADSRWSVAGLLSGTVLAALAAFVLAYRLFPSPPVDVILGIIAGASPYAIVHRKRARRLLAFDRGLADAIDLIARSLQAGHSLSAAIEIVSEQAAEPVKSEFRTVYTQQNFGLPFREALLQLIQRVPSADLQFVVTAMLLQKETGGNLVDILERTNTVIRERLKLQGQLRVYTAQGRMSGWILSMLPVAMFLMINVVNPGYTRVLITDPVGQKLIAVGVAQVLVGVMVIRKVIRVQV